jgi:hypothetical protein
MPVAYIIADMIMLDTRRTRIPEGVANALELPETGAGGLDDL